MLKGQWFIQQMFIEQCMSQCSRLGIVINEIDQAASSMELICGVSSLTGGDFRWGFACQIIEAGQWDRAESDKAMQASRLGEAIA